jgi:hypothetical protein
MVYLIIYIQSQEKITIGFNWYENTSEEENNDGKYIDFLKKDCKDRKNTKNIFLNYIGN